MKRVDRYILRAFLTNYVIALSVMIGLYVVLDLFVNLDEFTKAAPTATQTLRNIISFYGWNMFMYFGQLAGVIVLVAGCFTLGRFLRTNELTAILASGTSFFRVATPLLLAGIGLNGLWLLNQELVIPRIADKLARRHDDAEGRRTYAIWFLRDRGNALLSASKFDPHTSLMENVMIVKRDAAGRMTDVIRADRARWDTERGVWHLELAKQAVGLGRDSTGGVEGPVAATMLTEYASDLTPYELKLRQASQWTSFLSLRDLTRLQQRYASTQEFIKVKHARLTTPFINVLMLLLGIPFFLNRERPTVIMAGGRCLLVCGACFVLTFICQNVDVAKLAINPALPPWLPLLIFAPVMVLLVDSIKT
ncbi:MAG: LptF/LptG family permease [Phycisphaerae bacterium]|nr:LptF/LptG family permease [Phycisphaerae bacterium]